MIASIVAWIQGLFGGTAASPAALAAGNPTPGADGYTHPTGGKGLLTSPFGPRIHPITKQPQNHNGQDIAVPVGTPILAVQDGKVTMRKDDHPIAGRYVGIAHAGGITSEYLHLSRADVKIGDTVKRGQVIGLSGGGKGISGAGRSTGPHLHFIIKKGAEAVDPPSVISALKLTPKR